MKIALLLNQSHSGGTALIKVSFLYNLAFLLENEFFYLQITNRLTLLTFSLILKLTWVGVKRVLLDNPIAFHLHFCPAWLSDLGCASPWFNTITTQWDGVKGKKWNWTFSGLLPFPWFPIHQKAPSLPQLLPANDIPVSSPRRSQGSMNEICNLIEKKARYAN